MNSADKAYRLLQRHLDRQAVGFPAVRSGADIRFLKMLFTPEEAKAALCLSYRPSPLSRITASAAPQFTAGRMEQALEGMVAKGAIGWKKKNGVSHWFLMPVVVGIYEAQIGHFTPEFMAAAHDYMKSLAFGKAFLAVKPSQMRTIPINRSIPVEHHVAAYDDIRATVQNSPGPFAALKCICREGKAMQNKPCKKTSRLETCLALGDLAAMALRGKAGRELTREETLALLRQNEDDGLVLQCANARQPEFVCSCCGCCCGMLSFQKLLPRPLDFWTAGYCAELDAKACTGCGKCAKRCQVNAITMSGRGKKAKLNLSRCIGCGLCVTTCPSKALRLRKREPGIPLSADSEELYDTIMANKKGALGQWLLLLKAALRI